MLIVTHDTLRNPGILAVRQLPRKFFGRVTVWPRGRIGIGLLLRIVIEFQWVRFALPLLPLVAVALVWRGTAVHLSQAPLMMFLMVWLVEMRLLRVSPARRAGLIDVAEAERGLDLLRVQSRAALTRIVAGRGLQTGRFHLVIEQSELGLLPPLTYVSLQSEDGPHVVSMTEAERDIIADILFQPPLTEALLHRINQSQDVFLRDITLEARAVSAHARLAAALA